MTIERRSWLLLLSGIALRHLRRRRVQIPGRTLWLRAVLQAPTNVSEVVLEAGDACVVEARVNRVSRLLNKRCPTAPAAARFSATEYLVPGPNLVELELRGERLHPGSRHASRSALHHRREARG